MNDRAAPLHVSLDSGIKDLVVVIMELLKFVSDVWRECIFRVQAHTGVVLKVTSGLLGRGHGSQEGVEEVATLMVLYFTLL